METLGGDNLSEANSSSWQAWPGVRLAQDCYMIVNGLAQEILILLFGKAVYLNVGCLPCSLQQIFVKSGVSGE